MATSSYVRCIAMGREQWHLRAVRVNVIYRRRILGGDDLWLLYELKQLCRVRHLRYANHCVPLPRFIICVRSTRHRKSLRWQRETRLQSFWFRYSLCHAQALMAARSEYGNIFFSQTEWQLEPLFLALMDCGAHSGFAGYTIHLAIHIHFEELN